MALSSLTVLSFGCNCRIDHDGFRPTDLSFVLGVRLVPGFWSFQVCPITFGNRARTMGEPTTEGLAKVRRVRGEHQGLCTKLVAEANMIVGKSSLPEGQGIQLSPELASRLVVADSTLAKQLAQLEKWTTKYFMILYDSFFSRRGRGKRDRTGWND